MTHFDPAENSRRIKAGLLAAISGRPLEFARENSNLIAVFDGPFTKYSSGRITLFQEYVYEIAGVAPEFIREVPACIKVFFKLQIEERDRLNHVLAALESAEAKEMYRSLGISQLQFAGKIITPTI